MTDQFVVDCYFVGRESNNLILQDRRLKFAQTHLEILSPKPDEAPRIVSCSQFQFKIPYAGKKHLNFPFRPESEYLWVLQWTNIGFLICLFFSGHLKCCSNQNTSNISVGSWSSSMKCLSRIRTVSENILNFWKKRVKKWFNNLSGMQNKKPKSKQVPLIVSTEVLNKDIYQIRPIYNEKNCLAELERQRSQSRAMNVSPVSQQTPPKQLPSLGYMKQLVSRSDAIDSFTNTFPAKKEWVLYYYNVKLLSHNHFFAYMWQLSFREPDVTLYKAAKSNRSQNASPMDFEPFENPVERLPKKEGVAYQNVQYISWTFLFTYSNFLPENLLSLTSHRRNQIVSKLVHQRICSLLQSQRCRSQENWTMRFLQNRSRWFLK